MLWLLWWSLCLFVAQYIDSVESNAYQISTMAGSGSSTSAGNNVPATSATFNGLRSIFQDFNGNFFTSEPGANVVRKITTGVVSTYAGVMNAANTFSGSGTKATSANLYFPMDICVDTTGLLYFIDVFNYRARTVSTSGIVTTIAGEI